jgi:hypothetical protein
MRIHRVVAAALAALLCACTGGSEPPAKITDQSFTCTFFPKNSTTKTSVDACSGSGCTITDADKAIDGDAETFALMTLPQGAGGGAALRAIAPSGTQFPAGNNVGAVVSWDAGASIEDNVVIRTYLGDVVQDEDSAEGFDFRGSSTYNGMFLGITTTKPFDSVEFEFDRVTGDEWDIHVQEFCTQEEKTEESPAP